MNYWLSELSNLSECGQPLFDAISELSIAGQGVAREHYGPRGWVAHQNLDI